MVVRGIEMKIKLVFAFAVFFILVVFGSAAYCFLNSLYWAFALVALLLLTIVISFIGLLLYRRFIGKRLVDPKSNFKRNYSRLLLGEINSSVSIDENTLDLRGYCRNAYTDILLAQRYYSFLAKNGCVEIYGCESNYYKYSKKISPVDYLLLHPVTLLENGISSSSRKYAQFNPFVGIVFLISIIKNTFAKKDSSDKEIFDELMDFCIKRKLTLEIK